MSRLESVLKFRSVKAWRLWGARLLRIVMFAALALSWRASLSPAQPSWRALLTSSESSREQKQISQIPRRRDERRPDEQLTVNLFNRLLTIGGELSIELEQRHDFALDDEAEDDLLRLDQSLEIELFYIISPRLDLFLEGELKYRADLYAEDGDRDVRWEIERGEMWLRWRRLFGEPIDLQVGRQSFEDRREWWWGADLDAVRLRYDREPIRAAFSMAQEVAVETSDERRIDPEQQGVLRLLGEISWTWRPQHALTGFVLYQNDHSEQQREGMILDADRRDATDADLTWLGVRAMGRVKDKRFGEWRYWLDIAGVVGHEVVVGFDRAEDGRRVVDEQAGIEQDVRGWAFDMGASWRLPLSLRPTVTLGLAVGSGDQDPKRGPDKAFRQTGLQENEGRFRGVNSFQYYGELLQPELSNLQIWTIALGGRILKRSSIEWVYHYYRQLEPNDFLRDARIDADPEGRKRAIGQEWNLIVGIEEWKHWEIEGMIALFRAGSAFGDLSGEWAYQCTLEVDYNF